MCLIGLAMSMVIIVTRLSKREILIVLDDGVTSFGNRVPLTEKINWIWQPQCLAIFPVHPHLLPLQLLKLTMKLILHSYAMKGE